MRQALPPPPPGRRSPRRAQSRPAREIAPSGGGWRPASSETPAPARRIERERDPAPRGAPPAGAARRTPGLNHEREPAGSLSSRRRQSRPGLAAGQAPLLTLPLKNLV